MIPTPENISEKEYWDNYHIATKTFNLESIEKPDMSRYLIHLTGKGELLSIIKGKSGSNEIGYIKPSTPHYDRRENTNEVVCFSESPIYALDFFRLKSKSRWERNHMYGIGFFKQDLISCGVRPIIHSDKELNKAINHLHHVIADGELDLDPLGEYFSNKIRYVISEIYNLNFPLMEDHKYQGFSWEKEWRMSNGDGLEFDHSLIKIICCPEDEITEIQTALGNNADKVQFYSNWSEYNEVTDFLRRRRSHLELSGLNRISQTKKIEELQYLKSKTQITIHNLEKYLNTTQTLSNRMDEEALEFIKGLKEYVPQLTKQIIKLEQNNNSKKT